MATKLISCGGNLNFKLFYSCINVTGYERIYMND